MNDTDVREEKTFDCYYFFYLNHNHRTFISQVSKEKLFRCAYAVVVVR